MMAMAMQKMLLLMICSVLLLSGGFARAEEAGKHVISCPQTVAYSIDKTTHKGWSVYTHDSIRLELADIFISERGLVDKIIGNEEHDGETLLPDHVETKPRDPKTNGEVKISLWNLGSARQRLKSATGQHLRLVCDYAGGTTELSTAIPSSVAICKLIEYQIDPVDFHGPKIEMSCY